MGTFSRIVAFATLDLDFDLGGVRFLFLRAVVRFALFFRFGKLTSLLHLSVVHTKVADVVTFSQNLVSP